jgi:hypothetical protein
MPPPLMPAPGAVDGQPSGGCAAPPAVHDQANSRLLSYSADAAINAAARVPSFVVPLLALNAGACAPRSFLLVPRSS